MRVLNDPPAWHAVLGNHDYGDCGYDEEKGEVECPLAADAARSPLFQLDPALRKRDWRWHCNRAFEHRPVADAHLFFIDTSPHVESYTARPWYGGAGCNQFNPC